MKQVVRILIILLVGFGLGICAEKYVFGPKPIFPGDVVIPDSIVQPENEIIDSLNHLDSTLISNSEALKDSIKVIYRIRYIKVDSVKKLPLDSGIMYLRAKLKEYEE